MIHVLGKKEKVQVNVWFMIYDFKWGVGSLFYENEFVDCIVFPKRFSKISLTRYLIYVLHFPSSGYQALRLLKFRFSKMSLTKYLILNATCFLVSTNNVILKRSCRDIEVETSYIKRVYVRLKPGHSHFIATFKL